MARKRAKPARRTKVVNTAPSYRKRRIRVRRKR
jgi:hypothetical protein